MPQAGAKHVGTAWRSVWRSLAWRSVTLVLLGVVLSLLLHHASQEGPLAAAREALLAAHLSAQAYGRPPADMPAAARIVAFDEDYCAGRSGADPADCQPSGPVDRADIARMVERAALARPAAIVVDFVPLARDGCEGGTAALIRAIMDASRTAPVILPRPSAGGARVRLEGGSFLDQCPQALTDGDWAALAAGDRVFFGHAELEPTRPSGLIGAVRPWLWYDLAGPRALRRRVPAISLVAALAVRAGDGRETFRLLQASGLETRWHPLGDGPRPPVPLAYCSAPSAAPCDIAVGEGTAPPAPLRLSFRVGWEPSAPASSQEEERDAIVTHISARNFTEERARRLARNAGRRSVVVIAPTLAAYGDMHRTLLGARSGGVVHAAAVLDFAANGFITAPAPWAAFRDDVGAILLLALLTSGATAAAVFLVGRAWGDRERLGMRFEAMECLEIAWPTILLALSVMEAVHVWDSMHADFREGVFSYAICAAIVAFAHCFAAAEEHMGWLGRTVFRTGGDREPDHAPHDDRPAGHDRTPGVE